MALPATINASLSWPDFKNTTLGPFESGSALYVVLPDRTNNTLEAWRSTDGGDTWSEQDAANHPAQTSSAGFRIVSVIQSGTTLAVAFHTATGLVVRPFDCSANTWGTATASVALAAANSVAGVHSESLIRRSDGDYVVLYCATENVMGTAYRRVKTRQYEGTSWSSATDIAGTGVELHYDPRAIVLGSSDMAHIFYTDTGAGDLKHRSLSSTNSLGTIQDIDTTANVGNYSVGLPVLDGSTVHVPYVDSGGDLIDAYATSAADPSWSTAAIASTNDPEYANSNPGALALDGTTVHRFWPNDADQDIYRNSSASATETEWKDAVTCQGISISKITGYIAVLYDDGGTVKYDRYTLGPAAITGTAAGTHQRITGSATGTALLAITGAAAGTAQRVTGSATGIETFTGTAAGTLQALTGAATGIQGTGGSAAGTFQALTGSATGAETFSGAAAGTLQALTGAATGSALLAITGTGTGTVQALTGAATGAETFSGTATGTAQHQTGSATGTAGGAPITGTAAGTVQHITGSATGTAGIAPVTGTAAGTLQALTGSATGVQGTGGSAAGAYQHITGAATGTETFSGAADGTFQALSGSATGAALLAIVGTAAADTPRLEGAASGTLAFSGSAAGTFARLIGSGNGLVANPVVGTGAGVFARLVGTATGSAGVAIVGPYGTWSGSTRKRGLVTASTRKDGNLGGSARADGLLGTSTRKAGELTTAGRKRGLWED